MISPSVCYTVYKFRSFILVLSCYLHFQVVFMYKKEKIGISNLLGNCGQFMKKADSKEITEKFHFEFHFYSTSDVIYFPI